MSDTSKSVEQIVARVSEGDEIRFYQDFYGGQWVELSSGWLFKKKTKHRLDPDEMIALRSAIRPRNGARRAS